MVISALLHKIEQVVRLTCIPTYIYIQPSENGSPLVAQTSLVYIINTNQSFAFTAVYLQDLCVNIFTTDQTMSPFLTAHSQRKCPFIKEIVPSTLFELPFSLDTFLHITHFIFLLATEVCIVSLFINMSPYLYSLNTQLLSVLVPTLS
jgi:hypothetical protein